MVKLSAAVLVIVVVASHLLHLLELVFGCIMLEIEARTPFLWSKLCQRIAISTYHTFDLVHNYLVII